MPTNNESEVMADIISTFEPSIAFIADQMSPFRNLIRRIAFEPGLGQQPKTITHHHERPTGYPEDLSTLNVPAQSAGVPSASGLGGPGSNGRVTARIIYSGQEERTHQLEVDAWRSNVVNVSDLQFKQGSDEVMENIFRGLANYGMNWMDDWYRVKNISMVDTKIVVRGKGQFERAEDSYGDYRSIVAHRWDELAQAGAAGTITLNASASAVDDTYNNEYVYIVSGTGAGQRRQITDYTGSTKVADVSPNWTVTPDNTSVYRVLKNSGLPLDELNWSVLRALNTDLFRYNAQQFAVGMAQGKPIFPLYASEEILEKLFLEDLKEEIKYYDAYANFTSRGITHAVRGFAPNPDVMCRRYDENMVPIYPWRNVDASNGGRKSEPNPNYRSVNAGGQAIYEAYTILTTETYECRPRPTTRASIGRATFDPHNYMGEIQWHNPEGIDALNDNLDHDFGFFRTDMQLSARPLRPEMGFTILARLPEYGV